MSDELQEIIKDLERRIEFRKKQQEAACCNGRLLDAGGFKCIIVGIAEVIEVIKTRMKEHHD